MLGQKPTNNVKEKPVTVGKAHFLMPPPQHQGVLTQTVCGFFLLYSSALLFLCVSGVPQPCLLDTLPGVPAGGQRLSGITRFASSLTFITIVRIMTSITNWQATVK